jgi:hypothetical protein
MNHIPAHTNMINSFSIVQSTEKGEVFWTDLVTVLLHQL